MQAEKSGDSRMERKEDWHRQNSGWPTTPLLTFRLGVGFRNTVRDAQMRIICLYPLRLIALDGKLYSYLPR